MSWGTEEKVVKCEEPATVAVALAITRETARSQKVNVVKLYEETATVAVLTAITRGIVRSLLETCRVARR